MLIGLPETVNRSKRRIKVKKKRPRLKGRKQKATTAIILLILAGSLGFSIFRDLSSALGDLRKARNFLQGGYREAKGHNFRAAENNLRGAGVHFSSAQQKLNKPSLSIIRVVPGLSNNLHAIDKITSSGAELSLAGLSLMTATKYFYSAHTGINLEINNGKINLEPFIKASSHIKKAKAHVVTALAEEQEISGWFLVPQIKEPLEKYSKGIIDLKKTVDRIDGALSTIPPFFGTGKERRYFLAVQNNAELRATGGLIGSYGIISANNGDLSLVDFNAITSLPVNDNFKAKTSDDFENCYGRYKSLSLWSNVNMSPDFPTVSDVLLQLYKNNVGERLDGVVALDPVGLSYLLEATGPITLPDKKIIVDAKNVIRLTEVDPYRIFKRDNCSRKNFLNEVSVSMWKHIIAGNIKNRSLLVDRIAKALSTRHMLLYSINPTEQEFFRRLGYAGRLRENHGDYLQVVVQNHGANKIDVYLDQDISYKATIRSDGSISSKATVTLKNNAPKVGLPPEVAGVSYLGARNGQNNAYLSVYVPKGSVLTECVHDNKPGDPEIGQEKDKTIFSQYLCVPAGEQQTVSFVYENSYEMPGSVTSYRLDWQYQPVLRNPHINLAVRCPKKYKAISLSDGLEQRDNVVVSSGQLGKDSAFSFRLEPGGK